MSNNGIRCDQEFNSCDVLLATCPTGLTALSTRQYTMNCESGPSSIGA
jgi:hypothetical protein